MKLESFKAHHTHNSKSLKLKTYIFSSLKHFIHFEGVSETYLKKNCLKAFTPEINRF